MKITYTFETFEQRQEAVDMFILEGFDTRDIDAQGYTDLIIVGEWSQEVIEFFEQLMNEYDIVWLEKKEE